MYRVPFREAVLRVYEYTGSLRKASRICGVSIASISRWSRQLEPCKRAKRRTFLSDAIVSSVDAFMRYKTRLLLLFKTRGGLPSLGNLLTALFGALVSPSSARGNVANARIPRKTMLSRDFLSSSIVRACRGRLRLLMRVGSTSGRFPSMGMLRLDHLQSLSMTAVKTVNARIYSWQSIKQEHARVVYRITLCGVRNLLASSQHFHLPQGLPSCSIM